MKKILVLVFVLAVSLLGATAALAVIAGSQHDLTAGGRNIPGSATDPCMNCHTPHGGATAAGVPPLWNRDLGGANQGGRAGLDPRASQTCLSCHDGVLSTIAMNAPGIGLANSAQNFGAWTPRVNGFFDLFSASGDGTLTNDHPIGTAGDTTGLFNTAGWQPAAPANLPLYDGAGATGGTQVECATCHDVHAGDGTLNGLFLRTPFACADCHNK